MEKTKVVAYCRVSTDKEDQLNSLEMQKEFFADYAESKGYDLIDIYADEGISGTKTRNRTEFLRMMRDAKKKRFDKILTKDISRVARNTLDFLNAVRELKSYGVEMIFLTANMTNMGESEMLLTMFAAMAQEESANTSKRVKFGKKKNAENGRVPNIVYGYDKTKGDYFNLTINEKEAEIVKRIFNYYINEGYGALKIANILNAEGERTKRNCKWSQNAIARILANELYTGKIINGKQEVKDFLTGSREKKDEKDWFVVERSDLQIIDKKTFNEAQKLIKSRYDAFHCAKCRQSSKHLFSTVIRCKECGYSFERCDRKYKTHAIKWICSKRYGYGTDCCSNTITIDEEDLIEVLDQYLLERFKQKDKLIQEVTKAFNEKYANSSDQKSEKEYNKELEELERKKDKYIELYVAEVISKKELDEKLAPVNHRMKVVEGELELIKNQIGKADHLKSIIETTIKRMGNFTSVRNMTNGELKRIVEKIEVDKEGKIQIFLRLATEMDLDDTLQVWYSST